jgi:hypothetical protein
LAKAEDHYVFKLPVNPAIEAVFINKYKKDASNFIVRLKFKKRSALKFVSRTIPLKAEGMIVQGLPWGSYT